jgi:hypothetical protein
MEFLDTKDLLSGDISYLCEDLDMFLDVVKKPSAVSIIFNPQLFLGIGCECQLQDISLFVPTNGDNDSFDAHAYFSCVNVPIDFAQSVPNANASGIDITGAKNRKL